MQLKKILDILHGAAGRLIFKCLLVLLPFFVYYPSLSYENVYLDDDALTENSSAGIKKIFSKDVFLGKDTKSGFYRPLMALSFYADRRISQFLRPNTDNHQIPHGMLFISHFCNILLHGIFCLFLYEMLLSYGNSARMSCCCAALFAVIPYNAVAVSWLGGRNDILLGIFLLVSSIYIKKYSEKYAFRHLAALSLFFLLALFTKETAIAFVIPAFVLLFADTHEKKHFLRLFIALSLPVMIYFLCRFNADLAQNAFSHIDLKGIFKLPYLFCGYLLSIPFFSSVPGILSFFIAYMFVFLMLFFPFFIHSRKKIYIFAGIAWFLCFFAPPLLSTDSPEGWFYMRHRLYVPLAGFFLYVLPCSARFFSGKRSAWAFFAVFFVFFCMNSGIDSRNFKNRLDFSIKQAEEDSLKLGYYLHTAGGWHFEHGEYDFAYVYYQKGRQAGYETPFSSLHMAAIEMAKGNFQAGFEEIRQGAEKFPDDPYLKENLARLAQAGY